MVIKPIPKTTKTTMPPLVEVGEVKVLPKSMPGSFKFKLPAETMPPPPHQPRPRPSCCPSLAASLAVPMPVLIPRQPLSPPPDALLRTEAEAAEARLSKLRTLIGVRADADGGADAEVPMAVPMPVLPEAAEATAAGVPAALGGAGSAGDEDSSDSEWWTRI